MFSQTYLSALLGPVCLPTSDNSRALLAQWTVLCLTEFCLLVSLHGNLANSHSSGTASGFRATNQQMSKQALAPALHQQMDVTFNCSSALARCEVCPEAHGVSALCHIFWEQWSRLVVSFYDTALGRVHRPTVQMTPHTMCSKVAQNAAPGNVCGMVCNRGCPSIPRWSPEPKLMGSIIA